MGPVTPRPPRCIPVGSRFATVEDLFALPPEDAARVELWCPSAALGWMPVDRLLDRRTVGEASLVSAPSGMVVVVRDRA